MPDRDQALNPESMPSSTSPAGGVPPHATTQPGSAELAASRPDPDGLKAFSLGPVKSTLGEVGSAYGAPFGRQRGVDRSPSGPVTVKQVPLVEGYDEGGAYWGSGQNLYVAEDGENFRSFLRAESRMDAQAAIAKEHPGIEFAREFDTHAFVETYLEAAVWGLDDEERLGLDRTPDTSDFSPESRAQAEQECIKFIEANIQDLQQMDEGRAGFCFFMNRNGAGTGFWDESSITADVGRRLSDASHAEGSRNVYAGDDGRLYFG